MIKRVPSKTGNQKQLLYLIQSLKDQIADKQDSIVKFSTSSSSSGISAGGSSGTPSHEDLDGLNSGTYLDGGHTYLIPVHQVAANPTVNDDVDTYKVGTVWINTSTDAVYVCADNTNGAAVWTAVGGGSYTDEQAQDAIGTILVDSSQIDFTYNDATPSITATVKVDSINDTHIDWGTGANQVSTDDIPEGATNKFSKWTRTGTDLIPTTADDDLLLHDGSKIQWGNGNPGTADTAIGRISASIAGVDSGDAFRAGRFVEVDTTNSIVTPSAGFAQIGVETGNNRAYASMSDGTAHDLSCLSKQVWHLSSGENAATEKFTTFFNKAATGAGYTSTSTINTVDYGTGYVTDSYTRVRLLYRAAGPGPIYPPLDYCNFMFSAPFRKFQNELVNDGACKVLAKIRVRWGNSVTPTATTLDYVKFFICEEGSSTNRADTGDIDGTLTTSWQEFTIALTDVTSWTSNLRWGFMFLHNAAPQPAARNESHYIDIERVTIEQWVK